MFANCSESDRGCLSNDIRHTVESRGKLVIKSEGGRLGKLHHAHAGLCQGTWRGFGLVLDSVMDRDRANEGVVKRWPRGKSCAGWNSWCYLFCGLIATFSPSNFVCSKESIYAPCGFYFDFGIVGCYLVLVGFVLVFICFVGGCCCCCFSPKKITAGFLASEFRILTLRKMSHFQIKADLWALSLYQDQI